MHNRWSQHISSKCSEDRIINPSLSHHEAIGADGLSAFMGSLQSCSRWLGAAIDDE
jgi:hypothetical protein